MFGGAIAPMNTAAEICLSISQEMIVLRETPGRPGAALIALLEQLQTANADSPLDVLAVAALSRELLSGALRFPVQDDEDDLRTIAAVALRFLDQAVEGMEAVTGFSSDGFVGKSGMVN